MVLKGDVFQGNGSLHAQLRAFLQLDGEAIGQEGQERPVVENPVLFRTRQG